MNPLRLALSALLTGCGISSSLPTDFKEVSRCEWRFIEANSS